MTDKRIKVRCTDAALDYLAEIGYDPVALQLPELPPCQRLAPSSSACHSSHNLPACENDNRRLHLPPAHTLSCSPLSSVPLLGVRCTAAAARSSQGARDPGVYLCLSVCACATGRPRMWKRVTNEYLRRHTHTLSSLLTVAHSLTLCASVFPPDGKRNLGWHLPGW